MISRIKDLSNSLIDDGYNTSVEELLIAAAKCNVRDIDSMVEAIGCDEISCMNCPAYLKADNEMSYAKPENSQCFLLYLASDIEMQDERRRTAFLLTLSSLLDNLLGALTKAQPDRL